MHKVSVTVVVILHTDGDPSNYLTYFKRAAVYLAMGQTKKALPDLTSCIRLKPDFQQVCVQIYVVYMYTV